MISKSLTKFGEKFQGRGSFCPAEPCWFWNSFFKTISRTCHTGFIMEHKACTRHPAWPETHVISRLEQNAWREQGSISLLDSRALRRAVCLHPNAEAGSYTLFIIIGLHSWCRQLMQLSFTCKLLINRDDWADSSWPEQRSNLHPNPLTNLMGPEP